MKTKHTLLSLAVAGLCAVPASLLSADPVPPTPPGGTAAPPAADKPAAKPDGERRGPGGPGGERRMDPEARLKFMTEKLGLNQEQQDKIKAIQEKSAPQFKELMAKGRENLTEADKEKFKELMKTQMEETIAVLTPEQREKMKEMRPAGGPSGDRKPGQGRPKADDAK